MTTSDETQKPRAYYSERVGVHPTGGKLSWSGLIYLFTETFKDLERRGLFNEVFGYECVDAGYIEGNAGGNIEIFIYRKLKKGELWPVDKWANSYEEHDLFDMIELLHECASKGVEGRYHGYLECGWHYSTFDGPAGRAEFRSAVNELLRGWREGYQLLESGDIVSIAPAGLDELIAMPIGEGLSAHAERVGVAVDKYRRRGATEHDRRDAVRDLAAVLEYLRPTVKSLLTRKDESDLFELANSFGIRHHNASQKADYDAAIWLPWMFFYYLNTLHALERLLSRPEPGGAVDGPPALGDDADIPW
ncbi:hypothetical protein [Luteitalea sp.]